MATYTMNYGPEDTDGITADDLGLSDSGITADDLGLSDSDGITADDLGLA